MNIPQPVRNFVLQNPIPTALIALALAIVLYVFGSWVWTGIQTWELDRENKKLKSENTVLVQQAHDLQNKVDDDAKSIEFKDKEIQQKDALLQSIAKDVVSSKKKLDDATATAARIMDDDTPMSRDELKEKLCAEYNIPPAACK